MVTRNRNILVTGGAGFIGSHLVDALINQGMTVTVVDNLSQGRRENVNEKAQFAEVDLLDYHLVKKVIRNKQVIFHLAASATTKESSMGWNDPLYDYQVNAIGTLNLLKAIVENGGVPKFIYASSAAVYGNPEYTPMDEKHPTNPISPYGISKLAGEKYSHAYFSEYGINSTVLRIFNTYGPRQPRYVMFDLLNKLHEDSSRLEVLGTGKQVRDYCYVSDVVNAFTLAADKSPPGSIFNIAGGETITIRDVAMKLVKISGLQSITAINYTGESWKGDISILISDISKARKLLGFEPKINLEEGLLKLREWFLGHQGSKPE